LGCGHPAERLASALLSCGDETTRNTARTVRLAERAVSATHRTSVKALRTLPDAYKAAPGPVGARHPPSHRRSLAIPSLAIPSSGVGGCPANSTAPPGAW